MPAGYHRGMKTGGGRTYIKTKHKEVKVKKGIRNWPATYTFQGKKYYMHSVRTKKPSQVELNSLRKQGYYVRLITKKHPKYGYQYAIMTRPWIGKFEIVVSPKGPISKSKKKNRKK